MLTSFSKCLNPYGIPKEETMDQVFVRLRREREDILNHIAQGQDKAVGNSDLVVVSKDFQDKAGVQSIARAEKTGDKYVLTMAPRTYNIETKWEIPPVGAVPIFSEEKITYSLPVRKGVKDAFNTVETLLFAKMNRSVGTVCLVDPAQGSVWRSKPYRWVVYFSPKYEKAWFYKEPQFANIECLSRIPQDMVCYYGSNGRRGVDNDAYVSLLASPYDQSPFTRFSKVWKPGMVTYHYTRKGRPVRACLEVQGDEYSPEDVELYLGFVPERVRFFLFTNALQIPHIRDSKERLVGFLEDYPPYQAGVSEDDKYVYDVYLPGTTWTQRQKQRTIEAEARGKDVAPLKEKGNFEVYWGGSVPVKSCTMRSIVRGKGLFFVPKDVHSVSSDTGVQGRRLRIIGVGVKGPIWKSNPVFHYSYAIQVGGVLHVSPIHEGEIYCGVGSEANNMAMVGMYQMNPFHQMMKKHPREPAGSVSKVLEVLEEQPAQRLRYHGVPLSSVAHLESRNEMAMRLLLLRSQSVVQQTENDETYLVHYKNIADVVAKDGVLVPIPSVIDLIKQDEVVTIDRGPHNFFSSILLSMGVPFWEEVVGNKIQYSSLRKDYHDLSTVHYDGYFEDEDSRWDDNQDLQETDWGGTTSDASEGDGLVLNTS